MVRTARGGKRGGSEGGIFSRRQRDRFSRYVRYCDRQKGGERGETSVTVLGRGSGSGKIRGGRRTGGTQGSGRWEKR